jgi:hypothetical protein
MNRINKRSVDRKSSPGQHQEFPSLERNVEFLESDEFFSVELMTRGVVNYFMRLAQRRHLIMIGLF